MTNNRSKEEIIAKMLTVAASASSVKQTFIMYKAALSYTQLRKYLPFLEESGMMSRTSDGEWAITASGEEYLKAYDTMQRMMRPESQESPELVARLESR